MGGEDTAVRGENSREQKGVKMGGHSRSWGGILAAKKRCGWKPMCEKEKWGRFAKWRWGENVSARRKAPPRRCRVWKSDTSVGGR